MQSVYFAIALAMVRQHPRIHLRERKSAPETGRKPYRFQSKGDQKGGSNERDSLVVGQSGFIHAEDNALIKLDYNNPKYKKFCLNFDLLFFKFFA